jgi:hypothetical protein
VRQFLAFFIIVSPIDSEPFSIANHIENLLARRKSGLISAAELHDSLVKAARSLSDTEAEIVWIMYYIPQPFAGIDMLVDCPEEPLLSTDRMIVCISGLSIYT